MAPVTYTRKDVEDLVREGRAEITLEAGARITAEALEQAGKLGVRVRGEGGELRHERYPGPFNAWNVPHLLAWDEPAGAPGPYDGWNPPKEASAPAGPFDGWNPASGDSTAAGRSAELPGGVGGVGRGPYNGWSAGRPRPPRVPKRIYITVRDLDRIAASGETRLLLDEGTRLTDEADERAAKLGISIEQGGSR